VLPSRPAPGGSSGSTNRGSTVVIWASSRCETPFGRDTRSASSVVQGMALVNCRGTRGQNLGARPVGACRSGTYEVPRPAPPELAGQRPNPIFERYTRDGWPEQMRLLVRRTRWSAKHVKKLTPFELATGWRYQIVATNIGRMWGIAGSHHPQWLDVLHRAHAGVEDRIRTNKAMGLGKLPAARGPPTTAGSLRRTSPPTWTPGPGYSACMTTTTSP
jgi:hypothetical protein